MRHVGRDEGGAASSEIRLELPAERHVMLGKHVLELIVVAFRQMRVRADEERRPIIFNPCREFVELAIDAVEQNYPAHAIFGEAANGQGVGGGQKAAAVADDEYRDVTV